MDPKSFLLSKTLWLQVILLFVTNVFGSDLGIDASGKITIDIFAVVNILLRFVTKKPIAIT